MMAKKITLEQTGWILRGEVDAEGHLGDRGEVEMDAVYVPLEELTIERVHSAINDGGIGVEVIHKAYVDVYELYEDDYDRYARFRTTLVIENPRHHLVKRGI